jgi:hypothetical protein
MSFKKNKYYVCRKVVSKDIIKFLYDYLLMKRELCKSLHKYNLISMFDTSFGIIGSDGQIDQNNVYSCYGDLAADLLLKQTMDHVENIVKLKLQPNYSYLRIYEEGNELKPHIDRMACEFSTTLNIGGDPWSIYLKDKKNKNIEVKLKPGDMLIYKGQELTHWRKKFEGDMCIQVFLHYNQVGVGRLYDGRPCLGSAADTRLNDKKI